MTSHSTSHVKKLLTTLRDTPADTAGASDEVLRDVYLYLMNASSSAQGNIHWFCDKADPTVIEAATFLIRLMAYRSDEVTKWKLKLHQCLSGCAMCVQGFEKVKVTSRLTYLAAFPEATLREFFVEFEKWELSEVIADIERTTSSHASSSQALPESKLPAATLYRMLWNWTVFTDPRVLSFFQTHSIPDNLTGWPDGPFPPGLLVFLVLENAHLRKWAFSRASQSTLISLDAFSAPYVNAIALISSALLRQLHGLSQAQGSGQHQNFQFAQPSDFWTGLNGLLRLVPPQWLVSTAGQALEFRRVVLGHLQVQGSHFVQIFKCFNLLIKRLGKDLWNGEGPESPGTVLDAIRYNPSFDELLRSTNPSEPRSPYLAWLREYLSVVRDHSAYKDIFAKVISLLCEKAREAKFEDVGPVLMNFAMNILLSEVPQSMFTSGKSQQSALDSVLISCANDIVPVAYGRDFQDSKWIKARESARNLVEDIFSADIKATERTIEAICTNLGMAKADKAPLVFPNLHVRTHLWRTVYSSIQSTRNVTAIASLICTVSKSAHLDALKPSVFESYEAPDAAAFKLLLADINGALRVFQDGLSLAISTFAEYGTSTNGLEVLRCPGVAKAVILLLLSPVPDVHSAGISMTALAFDVDGRMECFRAFLENLPDETLDGMFGFLEMFQEYAAKLPEACSLSTTLVRSFADILDVLCASPGGLLHNSSFLRSQDDNGPASRLPEFWRLLTRALTRIYNRTPMWARVIAYGDMVIWMRDALILARDALKQWRVLESASNAYTKAPEKPPAAKISLLGKKMVDGLQEFLPELVRWLRLTDEELLHQSFSLLQSLLDLMKEMDIKPSPAGLAKLTKYLDSARTGQQSQSRLDKGRLVQLSDTVASFEEDEVEVVEINAPLKPTPQGASKEVPKPKPKVETRNYIQTGKSHQQTRITSSMVSKPSQPSVSKFFSDQDQKKLEASTSIPSFRKASTASSVASGSKASDTIRVQREPKKEKTPAQSDESSSDSSSEEDGPSESGLASLGKFIKSPRKLMAKPKPVERRQIKTIDIPAINKGVQDRLMRNRQVRNTALRLRPDISGLHRVVLSWDYNHDGPLPPGDSRRLSQIPDRFESYDHYFRVLQPLLLAECWAQLAQSKEEPQDSYQCKIDSRQYADDWLDIDMTIPDTVRKGWYLAETDIVILRNPDRSKNILAKVKSYKAMPSAIQTTIRCYTKAGPGDPGLQISTMWQVSKVFSLSTLHREFAALVSLQYNELCDFILKPYLPKGIEPESKDIRATMDAYKVNEPQAIAILQALKTDGFTLIQGPPGTGKTSTICGLLSRFLSTRPRAAVPIVPGKQTATTSLPPTARVLLCAPSNAAIDELAQRIKDGYIGSERKGKAPSIVRVGADQAISNSVKDISLDYLVDQKLDLNADPKTDIAGEIQSLRKKLEMVKQSRKAKIDEITVAPSTGGHTITLDSEIKALNVEKQALITRLDQLKDKQKSDNRTLDTLRRNTRHEILHSADIICSTLAGSGHEVLSNIEFDMIVIDEAAQAIELSSLIPLKYGCSHCVLVGDPQQLPPTVLSQDASRFGYSQSLFVRLMKSRRDATQLLSIQYRMHPDISRLPSSIFYESKLLDGPEMAAKTKRPWQSHPKFGTYKFLNVSWGTEESRGHSTWNQNECEVAIELYARLAEEFSSIMAVIRVGVVSMYKAQVTELRKRFIQRFGETILASIDFNTVDGFQGQEKDIIILSCVRSGPGLQTIGFLSDVRRMNVALTRAKSSLFILGNAPTLERSDEVWKRIVQDARTRTSLINIDKTYYGKAAFTKRHAPVSKPSHNTPAVVPPTPALRIPINLKTPSELASTSPKKPALSSPTTPMEAGPSLAESSSTSTVRGVKRPGAEDPATLPPAKRPSNPEQPRKRPKQQTMFIPKKRT